MKKIAANKNYRLTKRASVKIGPLAWRGSAAIMNEADRSLETLDILKSKLGGHTDKFERELKVLKDHLERIKTTALEIHESEQEKLN